MSSFIEFTPDLSCKHDDIDREHKKLFELVNSLHDAMKKGKGRDAVGSVLNSLIQYTETHFVNEEKLMSSVNYPGLYQQKREHADLLKQVNDLRTKFTKDQTVICMEAMTFLQRWLTEHIMVSDKKVGIFLLSKKS